MSCVGSSVSRLANMKLSIADVKRISCWLQAKRPTTLMNVKGVSIFITESWNLGAHTEPMCFRSVFTACYDWSPSEEVSMVVYYATFGLCCFSHHNLNVKWPKSPAQDIHLCRSCRYQLDQSGLFWPNTNSFMWWLRSWLESDSEGFWTWCLEVFWSPQQTHLL